MLKLILIYKSTKLDQIFEYLFIIFFFVHSNFRSSDLYFGANLEILMENVGKLRKV